MVVKSPSKSPKKSPKKHSPTSLKGVTEAYKKEIESNRSPFETVRFHLDKIISSGGSMKDFKESVRKFIKVLGFKDAQLMSVSSYDYGLGIGYESFDLMTSCAIYGRIDFLKALHQDGFKVDISFYQSLRIMKEMIKSAIKKGRVTSKNFRVTCVREDFYECLHYLLDLTVKSEGATKVAHYLKEGVNTKESRMVLKHVLDISKKNISESQLNTLYKAV
jgi:hypothetical protein